MKFPISLSVTSVNPDTDLPETKLCFLYVTECHKHFSCPLYHFNSSPPLLWQHAFVIISISPLFCISSLYVLFPGMSMLICVWRCARGRTRDSADSEKKQTRKGGQPKHSHMGEFPDFIYMIHNICILFYCC